MRWAAVLALLLVVQGPAWAGDQSQRLGRELHGLKGADDRVEVVARTYPWRALGRLNNNVGGHCSGVIIGSRLVATAAHCLWNPRTRRQIPISSLTFVAGYDRGRFVAASKVTGVHVAPGWDWNHQSVSSLSARESDWALLELAEPLGRDVGMVALGDDPVTGQAVIAAGYGKDKAHVPMAHLGCHVLQRRGALALNDCDAVQGDSGGPVLVTQNGELRVAALNVAVVLGGGSETGVALVVSAFKVPALRLGAATAGTLGALPIDSAVE